MSSTREARILTRYIEVRGCVESSSRLHFGGDLLSDSLIFHNTNSLQNSNAQVALVHDSDLPTYKRFATGWLSKGVVVTDNGIGKS